MKKRNCRKTPEEIEQHDFAVKLRKMTDKQLCDWMNELQGKSMDHERNVMKCGVKAFLINVSKCKGVGQATVAKLWDFAKEIGFLPESEEHHGTADT